MHYENLNCMGNYDISGSTMPVYVGKSGFADAMFSQDVLSTLMPCSPDITQHPMTNELKKSGTSKFASEQSIQQKLSLLPESGVLHGIGHRGLYVQPSHTESKWMAEFPWLWVVAAANVSIFGNISSCYQSNSENGNISSC